MRTKWKKPERGPSYGLSPPPSFDFASKTDRVLGGTEKSVVLTSRDRNEVRELSTRNKTTVADYFDTSPYVRFARELHTRKNVARGNFGRSVAWTDVVWFRSEYVSKRPRALGVRAVRRPRPVRGPSVRRYCNVHARGHVRFKSPVDFLLISGRPGYDVFAENYDTSKGSWENKNENNRASPIFPLRFPRSLVPVTTLDSRTRFYFYLFIFSINS